jgi:peptidoglycan/LPS O-acetylase OafA/YrhL
MVGYFTLGYRRSLDGVRGVAILAVMAYHFRSATHALPTRGGFLGVDIFFVLSGFLITSLLLEELAETGRVRLRLFYARRALRLLPALFTMIGLFLIWAVTLGPNAWVAGYLTDAFAAVFYFENWFRGFVRAGAHAGLEHTWSLSLEEQFYVLWPIALIASIRLGGRRAALIVAAGGAVTIPVVRALTYHAGHAAEIMFFTRFDMLLVGCLIAVFLARGTEWQPPRSLSWLAVVVISGFLIVAVITSRNLLLFGFSIFAAACGVVLWTLVTRPQWLITRLLERRTIVGIGRISYGLYLWHMPVFVMVRQYVPHVRFAGPLSLLLTFVVALASYRFVEWPFLRLKARLSSAKRTTPEDSLPQTEKAPSRLPPALLDQDAADVEPVPQRPAG